MKGYNAQEADRYFCEPPEPTKCEISGLDNCYQCPFETCEFWEEANIQALAKLRKDTNQ